MARIIEEKIIDGNKRYIEAYGLSTETKPTEQLVTGSMFIEVNTGSAYFWDETGETWHKVGE